MHSIKKILFITAILFSLNAIAQSNLSYEDVNTKSYALYEKGSWKELLAFGKEAIQANHDFTLLRLRMGYAAFMLNNFSEAIKQYEYVLKNDSYNNTAHYYIWLSRKYLNQAELADAQVKYLSKEIIEQEKLKSFAFTGIGVEASFKSTDINIRGNTNYEKIQLKNRLKWGLNMHQAVSLFKQSVLLPVTNGGSSIVYTNIQQTEYYNKLIANLNSKWQLKTAFHATQTEVNNNVYQNRTILLGLKYFNHYFDIQLDGNFSKMFDSTLSQYNAQIGIYPLGNLKLYGFSTAILRNRPSGSAFNFRQIIGAQLTKKIWLEGNVTLGPFQDLLENDALYLYNQLDKNLFKGGLITYISVTPKCTVELGYTLEQRELFKTKTTFNQHSITGGLTWKF